MPVGRGLTPGAASAARRAARVRIGVMGIE